MTYLIIDLDKGKQVAKFPAPEEISRTDLIEKARKVYPYRNIKVINQIDHKISRHKTIERTNPFLESYAPGVTWIDGLYRTSSNYSGYVAGRS